MKFIFDIKLKKDGGFESRYSYEEWDVDDADNIDLKAYRKGLVAAIKSTTGLGILDKEFEAKIKELAIAELERLKVC